MHMLAGLTSLKWKVECVKSELTDVDRRSHECSWELRPSELQRVDPFRLWISCSAVDVWGRWGSVRAFPLRCTWRSCDFRSQSKHGSWKRWMDLPISVCVSCPATDSRLFAPVSFVQLLCRTAPLSLPRPFWCSDPSLWKFVQTRRHKWIVRFWADCRELDRTEDAEVPCVHETVERFRACVQEASLFDEMINEWVNWFVKLELLYWSEHDWKNG